MRMGCQADYDLDCEGKKPKGCMCERCCRLKEYHKEYHKEYRKRPEYKIKRKEYRKRPEVKLKMKEYGRQHYIKNILKYKKNHTRWLKENYKRKQKTDRDYYKKNKKKLSKLRMISLVGYQS